VYGVALHVFEEPAASIFLTSLPTFWRIIVPLSLWNISIVREEFTAVPSANITSYVLNKYVICINYRVELHYSEDSTACAFRAALYYLCLHDIYSDVMEGYSLLPFSSNKRSNV
jgi:hypothetical protein